MKIGINMIKVGKPLKLGKNGGNFILRAPETKDDFGVDFYDDGTCRLLNHSDEPQWFTWEYRDDSNFIHCYGHNGNYRYLAFNFDSDHTHEKTVVEQLKNLILEKAIFG